MSEPQSQHLLDDIESRLRLWHERCADRPPQLLDRQPAPGVWSVKQNTFHLGDAFEASIHRVNAMLSSDCPQLLRFDADEWAAERRYQERPFDEALQALDKHVAAFVSLVRPLGPDELSRTGRQPNLAMNYLKLPTEVLTIDQLLVFEVGHVDEHLASVDEILTVWGNDSTGRTSG